MLARSSSPHRIALTAVFERYVRSSRYPDTEYHVSLLADGTWTCSCSAYGYGSRSDGQCRHIDAVKEEHERRLTLAFLLY